MPKRKFYIIKQDFIDDFGDPAKAGSIVLYINIDSIEYNQFWGYYFNEKINEYAQLVVKMEYVEPILRENIDKTILRKLEAAYQRFV